MTPTESAAPVTVARRLLLLLGLAYLFLATLTSGLACAGYFTGADGRENGEEPPRGASPPGPPRPPPRDPHAPGLHTRPDGGRYLVMPLPADLADRVDGRVEAVHASAMGGGAL
jgi:hypothetical protein